MYSSWLKLALIFLLTFNQVAASNMNSCNILRVFWGLTIRDINKLANTLQGVSYQLLNVLKKKSMYQ